MSAAGNDNANANSNNIILTIKKDNQNHQNLSKGFKRSVYWNEYKAKSKDEIREMNIFF